MAAAPKKIKIKMKPSGTGRTRLVDIRKKLEAKGVEGVVTKTTQTPEIIVDPDRVKEIVDAEWAKNPPAVPAPDPSVAPDLSAEDILIARRRKAREDARKAEAGG